MISQPAHAAPTVGVRYRYVVLGEGHQANSWCSSALPTWHIQSFTNPTNKLGAQNEHKFNNFREVCANHMSYLENYEITILFVRKVFEQGDVNQFSHWFPQTFFSNNQKLWIFHWWPFHVLEIFARQVICDFYTWSSHLFIWKASSHSQSFIW